MKYPPNLSKNILKAFSSPRDRCANETNSAEAIRVCFDDPRDQGAVLNLQELCLLAIVRNWQSKLVSFLFNTIIKDSVSSKSSRC